MIVKNPTDQSIHDYPIQDPKTKEVHLWSIGPGEQFKFPDYVGEYLLEVYGFLQRVVTQDQLDSENEQKKKVDSGKHFSQVLIAPNKKVEPQKPTGGFTTKLVKDNPGVNIPTVPSASGSGVIPVPSV